MSRAIHIIFVSVLFLMILTSKAATDEIEDPADIEMPETENTFRIPLPDKLPGGAVQILPNAKSRKAIPYSGNSRINIQGVPRLFVMRELSRGR